jgi:O-antigen ligase
MRTGSPRTRVRAAIAVCILAAALSALALGFGSVSLAFLPVAVALVFLLSLSTSAPYALVLVSVCSFVWWSAYPRVQVPGMQVSLSELVLLVCVAASGLHWLLDGVGLQIRERTDVVLVCLAAAAAAGGVVVAVANGTTLMDALRALESVAFYACIVPAVVALADPRNRGRILRFALGVALVMAVVQLLQLAVGPGQPLFDVGNFQDLLRMEQGAGMLRVRSPGLPLVYVAAAFTLAAMVWGPRRWRGPAATAFGLLVAGMLVSLNRNMALGLIAGYLAALACSRQRARGVLGLILAALLVTGALIAINSSTSSAITKRFASLIEAGGTGEGGAVQTLSDRAYENGYAISTLERSPLTGVGWGTAYGARVWWNSLTPEYHLMRQWLHNQYLFVWLRMGILGLIAVVALLVRAAAAGARWARRAPDETGWIGLGLVISVVAIGASSLVGMYLTDVNSVVPLAGLIALGFVLRNSTPALKAGDSVGRAPRPAEPASAD